MTTDDRQPAEPPIPAAASPQRRAGRPPVTLPDRLTIARLHERGYSDAQIAKALGLTPAHCREALQDARAVLEASALALVTDYLTASDIAARKGDHRPARDMLDRLHVTQPTASDATTNVGISVQVAGFTFPGLPLHVQANGSVQLASPGSAATAPVAPLTLNVPSSAAQRTQDEHAHTHEAQQAESGTTGGARDGQPARE